MHQYIRRTTDGFMLSMLSDGFVWIINHGTVKDNHFVVSVNDHELLSVDLSEILELVKTFITKPSVA